jgi:hypothetical protein
MTPCAVIGAGIILKRYATSSIGWIKAGSSEHGHEELGRRRVISRVHGIGCNETDLQSARTRLGKIERVGEPNLQTSASGAAPFGMTGVVVFKPLRAKKPASWA